MSSLPIATAESAPPWRRLAAMVYDALPLAGLWILGAGAWVIAFRGGYDPRRAGIALHLLLELWLLVIGVAYFLASWMRVGQTLGMRAWKIRLVREDGARVRAGQALARLALALVSLAALGAGFWAAWFDPQRRAWHDRVCRTRVIRA